MPVQTNPGFRLGIYVFKDAEIVDFAAPHGVFSVARRFAPELDGLPATNRKEPDRVEATPPGKVPLDRLADIAPRCRISRARVVDAGRIITAGGSRPAWRWASTCSGGQVSPTR
jgi:hypothetical protein